MSKKKVRDVSLPDSLLSVGSNAFAGCPLLTSVTYRGSVADASTMVIAAGNSALTGAQWHFTDGDGNYPAASSGALSSTVTWRVEGTTLTVSGRGAMPNFNESAVAPWHGHAASVQRVVISEGIRTIGSYAFRAFTALTEVSIPDSVTTIGMYAFEDTSQLSGITIPVGVTGIGDSAFQHSGLTSVSLPDSVTSLGRAVFERCYQLTSAKLPAGLERIPENTFWDNDKLAGIEIPEGVITIGYDAFYSCSALVNVSLPASLQTIEPEAFQNCSKLALVRYNDTEDAAFYLMIDTGNAPLLDAQWKYIFVDPLPGLTGVLRLPAAVTVIESEAFAGTAAQAVVIPDGATTIGSGAFSGNSSLLYVQVPESVTQIADDAFAGCEQVTVICEENGIIDSWAKEHGISTLNP